MVTSVTAATAPIPSAVSSGSNLLPRWAITAKSTLWPVYNKKLVCGVSLPPKVATLQDLNRAIETLIHQYGYSLLEAMEIAFPPIVNEIKQLEPDLQNLYVFLRQGFGPFAQGPAGIISRYADEVVFSVDALGLRPLWFGAIESDYFFSSEKGLFPLDDFIS